MNAGGSFKRSFYQFLFNPGIKQLYVVLFLFVLSFLLTKITFFFYYPLWCTTIDIYSYTDPLISITQHHLPVFDLRTPVYPLFLAFTYFTGFNLNAVLLFQMVITLLSCIAGVYLIFKYKKWFFLPFSVVLLLFYSSGDVTAMDTNLSPTVLFADLILVFAVCLVAAVESQKRKYFILSSLAFAAIILLRPQGLFLVGMMFAASVIYYVNHRSFKFLMPLILPAAIVYGLLLSYNFFTFGQFKYSKFGTLTKLGYVINILQESPDYPEALNEKIRAVNQSFGDQSKKSISANGLSLATLDTVYTNPHYDFCWSFLPIVKSNPELIEKLIATSNKSFPQNTWKEFVVGFLKYYKLDSKTTYFYFTELTNRRHYIEGDENFFDVKERRDVYGIVWRDWAKMVVDHKAGNYPILNPGTNYTAILHQQPILLRLINYYEVVYNMLFANKAWSLIYFASAFVALVFISLNLFRFNKIEPLLLLSFIPFLNSILVSMIIPPQYYYVFPTRFFFMLAPIIVLFYLFRNYGKHSD